MGRVQRCMGQGQTSGENDHQPGRRRSVSYGRVEEINPACRTQSHQKDQIFMEVVQLEVVGIRTFRQTQDWNRALGKNAED